MSHLYNVGTGTWVPDDKEGWVASKVVEREDDGDKVRLVVEITSGDRIGEVRSDCLKPP